MTPGSCRAATTAGQSSTRPSWPRRCASSPGANSYDRSTRLDKPSPRLYAAFARLPKRLNAFLAETAELVRGRFGGPLTYAAGTWEPVDWSRFDIVSVDAYRDASNARSIGADLRKQFRHGKPVVATEYGCCPTSAPRTRAAWAGTSPTTTTASPGSGASTGETSPSRARTCRN
jgi:hypothetical protein